MLFLLIKIALAVDFTWLKLKKSFTYGTVHLTFHSRHLHKTNVGISDFY